MFKFSITGVGNGELSEECEVVEYLYLFFLARAHLEQQRQWSQWRIVNRLYCQTVNEDMVSV